MIKTINISGRNFYFNTDLNKLCYKKGNLHNSYTKQSDYSNIRIYIGKKRYYIQRLIYKIHNPEFNLENENKVIKFKNGNKNDHTKQNLYIIDRVDNINNSKSINLNNSMNNNFEKLDFKKFIKYEKSRIKKRNNIILNF